MRDVLRQTVEAIHAHHPAALVVLVETRGSTPQKPGAAMLIFEDGSQVGTLGGGCVEAEVKRRALQRWGGPGRELVTFHLDNDYGWDDGLICGGRMTLLIDPVGSADDVHYFETYLQLVEAGAGCIEAIVVDPDRAGGGQAGDRFLFGPDGRMVARRSRAEAPPSVPRNFKPLSERPRPRVAEGVAYLTEQERCRLLIVGAGHIGQKVAELAAQVDFDVWILDDRDDYCNARRFPTASRLIVAPIDEALRHLEVNNNTMCVIVTRGHNHDEEALFFLAQTPARYIGMIGSKRKIKLILEDLLHAGIPRESLARVCAPIGFPIGSQTVPEIAVSIVAELIAC
ncbi:MAG TPA: XdhC/CoxI family protein, partial [Planctomycetaceae bacterium]|nr:XdhC/CoxI family protein [Planctomycetaceae bacterium]